MRRRLAQALMSVILLLAIAAVIVTRQVTGSADQPLRIAEDMVLVVSPGQTFNAILAEFDRRGIIRFTSAMRIWLRLEESTNRIAAGDYDVQAGISVRELLALLVSGRVKQYQVTLIEGWTLSQALAAIQSSPRISTTLDPQKPLAIAQLLDLSQDSPEGMIFPDTYLYTGGSSDASILLRANARLMEVLDAAWQSRLGALPYSSPYEALIMASVIEKETGLASERRDIAAVFINRLEQGMRLQSDPTVIYGLGDAFDGDLRRADLEQGNPYNTYRNNGLPPTPIALAGRDAIEAALNPAPVDFLYFVSRGDGSHQFSMTLEEHNAAVQRYQRGGPSRDM